MNLESLLDTNKKVYSFDGIIHGKGKNKESKIKAELILKNIENISDNVFVFLNKGSCENIYSIISIVCSEIDYSRGQHEECMLIKKKFLKKNFVETLFIHPSYFRNHLELVKNEQEYISRTSELQAILKNKLL